ncbi:hypothetical protein MMC10_006833 [Thelotrema lepadinum]|nr:hypothetical protein [Thelotrema lepadinum]
MELCAISNGGWETWLQVELWLLLRQHYPPSSGWTISREKRVYTDQLQRCDILVSRTNPTQASHEKHIIELKAEVSSDIDHQSGRSALRARVGREVDKFHGVAGGWRPATGWVVGVGGIAPAGNALANVQENWVRVGTPLEGFWGQEVGVFWTKVGL